MPYSIVNSVKNRIYGHGKGWVFTINNFADLGSSTGLRTALSRLQKEKIIRRVAQGIYYYPRTHKVLGLLTPSIDDVANAFAKKNGAQIQAAGAYAANIIGLSEQVPGRVVFLTDGPTDKVKIGKLEISFKKTTVKNMFAAGTKEALVIQAFKFMKKENISKIMLETTKQFLRGETQQDLNKFMKFAPHWIRVLIFDLMEDDEL